jgi:hypothetical protein
LLIIAALSAGCSDNSSKPPDARIDKKVVRDQPQLDLADAALDVAADRALRDTAVGDVRREGGKEKGTPDASKDKGPSDIGTPLIYGTITRSATPIGDAKGDLYIGLYFVGIPFMPLASTKLTADLSGSGATLTYGIYSSPGPGSYSLFAFLDDNGNAAGPFLLPDAGDLVMSAPVNVTVGTTPQKIDIALDKLEGSIGDGGLNLGALKGKVTATVAPSADGKGTLYVSLHDQVPPAGLLTSTLTNNADLSSPYGAETYFLSALAPGNYYLVVFLDDNANNNPFAPGPDKGDMVTAKAIQVHVVAGVQNVQDVVLDKLQP